MESLIKQIEEMSLNAHPDLNTVVYDGWLIRLGAGYTDRANSVQMLTGSSLPFEQKIQYCEQIYRKNHLASTFKVTPLSGTVDSYLEEAGYQKISLTDIMVIDLTDFRLEGLKTVVQEGITSEWENDYFRLNELNPIYHDAAKQIHKNVIPSTYTATISQGKEVVACGRSVIEQGYVSLYNIIVSKEQRRLGYGRDLCVSLLAHASRNGADKGYIQVVDNNEKAKALYMGLGFTPLYQYWYRKKPY